MIDINELRARTLEVQQREKAKEVKRLTDEHVDLIKGTERAMHKAAADGKYSVTVSNISKDEINALWAYFPDPFKKKLEQSGRGSTIIITWHPDENPS